MRAWAKSIGTCEETRVSAVNKNEGSSLQVSKNPLQVAHPSPSLRSPPLSVDMADSSERKHPKSGIFECDEAEGPIPNECERARLIGEISKLLREPLMPESTRIAGLTLIGWLARRMPGETAHALGVREARAEERRRTGSGRKAR